MGLAVADQLMLGQQHMDCGMHHAEIPEDAEGPHVLWDCCTNEYVSMENGDLFKNQLSKVSATSTYSPSGFAYLVNQVTSEQDDELDYSIFNPPSQHTDLVLSHQVFLI